MERNFLSEESYNMKHLDLGFTVESDDPSSQHAEKEQGRPTRDMEMRDRDRGGRASLQPSSHGFQSQVYFYSLDLGGLIFP